MPRHDGELTCSKETFVFRFEQLRRAVFRLRDTCGDAPLRTTLFDLAKFKHAKRVALPALPPTTKERR